MRCSPTGPQLQLFIFADSTPCSVTTLILIRSLLQHQYNSREAHAIYVTNKHTKKYKYFHVTSLEAPFPQIQIYVSFHGRGAKIGPFSRLLLRRPRQLKVCSFQALVKRGERRFSHRALLGALMICMYRQAKSQTKLRTKTTFLSVTKIIPPTARSRDSTSLTLSWWRWWTLTPWSPSGDVSP